MHNLKQLITPGRGERAAGEAGRGLAEDFRKSFKSLMTSKSHHANHTAGKSQKTH